MNFKIGQNSPSTEYTLKRSYFVPFEVPKSQFCSSRAEFITKHITIMQAYSKIVILKRNLEIIRLIISPCTLQVVYPSANVNKRKSKKAEATDTTTETSMKFSK